MEGLGESIKALITWLLITSILAILGVWKLVEIILMIIKGD